MKSDREILLEKLGLALKLKLLPPLHAKMHPRVTDSINHSSRFVLCLSGQKHVLYGDGLRKREAMLPPGGSAAAPPLTQLWELWDTPQEMLSICVFPEYTRLLYIRHDGIRPPPIGQGNFFHIPRNRIVGDLEVMNALLALQGQDPPAESALLHAILCIVRGALERLDESQLPSREYARVREAISNLFMQDVSREDIARHARVTPNQLSRLLKHHTGKSFRDSLNETRLAIAQSLLREPEITVEEVAHRCGFSYANYFIRLFHAKYGCTPGEYQRKMVSPDVSTEHSQ